MPRPLRVGELTGIGVADSCLPLPACRPLVEEATAGPRGARPGEQPAAGHGGLVRREDRATCGMTVWLTGLPGAGKSSVAAEVERRLVASGRPAYRLDGDVLRDGLNADLGFSPPDRAENVRRVGEVARILADAGLVAVVSLVSPYTADRENVRATHQASGLPFFEVFVDTSLEICEQRDPKGMYAKARAGEIRHFTGIDDPYEPPATPHLRLQPSDGDIDAQAAIVIDLIFPTATRQPVRGHARSLHNES